MKKDLYVICKRKLIFSILLSVGFVVSIPLIVISAINQAWLLLVLGIVLCLAGFYGSPISWMFYAQSRSKLKLLDIILHDKILSIEDLAMTINKSLSNTKKRVVSLIKSRYLTGYVIKDDVLLVPIATLSQSVNKCPNCGALLTVVGKGYYCEYCEYKSA